MFKLAIIPARGGSKGIKNKNIRKINNKTLLSYTIASAKSSKMFDDIIVSTDSEKIAIIAKNEGITVSNLRPKRFSQDSTSTEDVIKYELNMLSKHSIIPDIITILQPTSPIRNPSIIRKSIKLLENSHSTSVISVIKIKTHPYFSFYYPKNYLKPMNTNFEKFHQRQKYPDLYFPSGSVYTFWQKTLEKYDSIYGPRIKPIFENEITGLDINTKFDLFVADMYFRNWSDFINNQKF
jgi:CMP-N,N'-diacetyllegionaminic acid synthase